MAAAILTITIGGVLIYSALKGQSITDVFAGVAGATLDPTGSHPSVNSQGASQATSTDPGSSTDTSKYHFKGPNANLLGYLAGMAVSQFHLHITSTTRSLAENNAAGGAAGSLHLQGRAFDAAGAAADMAAYYQWVHDTYGHTIGELFYDPKGAVKNGQDIPAIGGHSDHVHTGA